jgi:CheY-like chemotaxis protein
VEDEAKTRELFVSPFCEAYGSRQGLEVAIAPQPDLIGLDLVMPELSGFEVVQPLQQQPHTREIPVFVVTAKALLAEEQQELNRLVAALTLKKTFAQQAFLEEIGIRMRRRVAQERRAQGWLANESCWWKITLRIGAWHSSYSNRTGIQSMKPPRARRPWNWPGRIGPSSS